MTALISPDVLRTFNPPASCFTQIWGSQGVSATTYGLLQGNPDDGACKPAGYNTATIYSPAVCPSSFYGGATNLVTDGTVTETVVKCCPTNFSLDRGVYGCVSSFSAALSTVLFTYSTDGATATGSKSLPSNGDRGWNAHSIQVRYQSSDIFTSSSSIAQTSSSTSNTLVTSTPSASASASATSVSIDPGTESQPETSSGLSTGAKAGIGVGAALGGIIVIALLLWIVRRKKMQRRVNDPVELTADSKPHEHAISTPRHEIDSGSGHSGFPEDDKAQLRPSVVEQTSAPTPPSELEAPR